MRYIPALILVLVNPWIWKLLQLDPISAVLCLILLFLLLRKKLILPLFLIISLILFFRVGLDKNIFNSTETEISNINQSRSYYPEKTAPLFQNKILLSGSKLTQNLFTSLDPNLYFFAGHPRERAGASEYPKIYWFFLPLLIFGLFKSHKYILLLPLLLSAFSNQTLMFPVIFYLLTPWPKKS